MKTPPVPGWVETTSLEEVIVPAYGKKGYKIAETIEVPAWKDPETEEIYLTDEAEHKLSMAKARYMGLLCPEQIFW